MRQGHVHLNQIELARRWRISPRMVERWRWLDHGLCFLKIGGRVAYRMEDVEAFEAAQLRARRTLVADHSLMHVAEAAVRAFSG